MPPIPSSSSSSRSTVPQHLSDETTRRRKEIQDQVDDDVEDPLAVYDQFVQWTLANYPPEFLGLSCLLEILEEVTRKFKKDEAIKADRRYLKMWFLYGSLVDRPSVVFKHLLTRGIGLGSAQLYLDYSLILERAGRCVILTLSYQPTLIHS